MPLTLPESIYLLALDDERGALRNDDHHALICLNYALAGAVIGESLLRGYLSVEPEAVVLLNQPPTGDPLLDDALRQIDAAQEARPPRDWVEHLRHTLHGLHHRLGERLAAQGIVRRTQHRLLGLIPIVRYPLLDSWLKTQLVSELTEAAFGRAELDARTRLLLALAWHAEVVTELFTGLCDDEAECVRARMAALAQTQPVAVAVAETIAFIEAPSVEGGAA